MGLKGYVGKFDEFSQMVKYAEINLKTPSISSGLVFLCTYLNIINTSEKILYIFPSYQNHSLWPSKEMYLEPDHIFYPFHTVPISKSGIVDALGTGFCLFSLISGPYYCITF